MCPFSPRAQGNYSSSPPGGGVCMKKVLLGIAVVVLIVTVFSAAPNLDEDLCAKGETVVFSYKMKDSKVLSVLVGKNDSYLVYRFGTRNKIETEYPAKKNGSWNNFVLVSVLYASAGGYSLYFTDGGLKYQIYDNEGRFGRAVGGSITNISTKNVTYFDETYQGIKGRLEDLKKYKNMRVVDEDDWNGQI